MHVDRISMELPILYFTEMVLLSTQSKEEGKDQEPMQSSMILYGKVTKTQENITYRRAKKSAFSEQVTTRLHKTDKTIWQRQTQKKNDPQTKYHLGRVSENIT